MKKIIVSLLLAASLQITAAEPMIINRTGKEIKVNYKNGADYLFTVNNEIALTGNADHAEDQMILIPSISIDKPGSDPAAKYQSSATKAVVKIGTQTLNIETFAANTSYVIEAGSTAGSFKKTGGLVKYNPTTGASTTGAGFDIVAGSGF